MKKFIIFFVFIIILFPKSILAEDISDYQIEGISIGDNLLDFLNKDDVLQFVELSKGSFSYLAEPNKYSEIYYQKDLKIYDYLSFIIETPNSNKFLTKKNEIYIVLSVRGGINFLNNLEGCINKRNELEKNIDRIFQKIKKTPDIYSHPLDPSGKSIKNDIYYEFKNGDIIVLSCNDWEETFRNKNGYSEGLSLVLRSKEVNDWMGNY